MNRTFVHIGIVLFLAATLTLQAMQQAASSSVPRGFLVLHGGRELGEATTRQFANRVGLPGSTLIVIPTAKYPQVTPAIVEREKQIMARFFGATKTIVLHARNRKEADSEVFAEQLRNSNAVWIQGGEDERLMATYAGTRTAAEIAAVFERGGLVGGTSAGASILSSFKIQLPESLQDNRGRIRKDEIGFGLLRNVAVHPHFTEMRRENHLVRITTLHPGLLGLGIDEDTGALIHNNQLEVLGPNKVHVFIDGHHDALSAGQRYDLATRSVVD